MKSISGICVFVFVGALLFTSLALSADPSQDDNKKNVNGEFVDAEPNQMPTERDGGGGGYGYGSGGNGGYSYGWGGKGGYGGRGWGGPGGGGGSWGGGGGGGGGCHHGCCGHYNRWGGCKYCCHNAEEAVSYLKSIQQFRP
ncbi:hypothetical protein DM860_007048 [Cuscuta australis]|uniref:Glycine-rich protein n=1 Tax=Cuscuta australis TaxID=267555 RepID=A0A328E7K5_9ASTE|nr:hypothetical protein DM860_007048 [Cuscuta australis]